MTFWDARRYLIPAWIATGFVVSLIFALALLEMWIAMLSLVVSGWFLFEFAVACWHVRYR